MTVSKPSAWSSPPVILAVIGLLLSILGTGVRNVLVLNSFMARADATYLSKVDADGKYLSCAVYEANHKALADLMAVQLQNNTRELSDLNGLIREHMRPGAGR
jgi:hypothetical protein